MTTEIRPGTRVHVRTAFGNIVPKVAVSGPEMSDFVVVRVATETEWSEAAAEGRDPAWVPWPIEDVTVDEPVST